MKMKLIKMMKTQIILFVIFSTFLKSNFLHAQGFLFNTGWQSFDSSSGGIELLGRDNTHFSRTSPVRLRLPNSRMRAQIELDLDANTIIFQRFEVEIETLHYEHHFRVLGDLDEIVATNIISGTIAFDPTLVFLDNEAIPLIPTEDEDQFRIGRSEWQRQIGQSEQTRMIGTYSFSGPTETRSGSFSINPFWRRSNHPSINVADFPNRVIIGESSNPYWNTEGENLPLTSENMDIAGLELSVEFDGIQIVTPVPFVFIPEASYSFASALLLFAFIFFRKMHHKMRLLIYEKEIISI